MPDLDFWASKSTTELEIEAAQRNIPIVPEHRFQIIATIMDYDVVVQAREGEYHEKSSNLDAASSENPLEEELAERMEQQLDEWKTKQDLTFLKYMEGGEEEYMETYEELILELCEGQEKKWEVECDEELKETYEELAHELSKEFEEKFEADKEKEVEKLLIQEYARAKGMTIDQ